MRGGKLVHLPSSELVPGDVVLLEAGDAVPADGRVLESASHEDRGGGPHRRVRAGREASQTHRASEGVDDVPLGDRKNMCYMGSTVVYGRGHAVVTGTGMDTEMGKIADALSQAKEEHTPLQIKLSQLSKILTCWSSASASSSLPWRSVCAGNLTA